MRLKSTQDVLSGDEFAFEQALRGRSKTSPNSRRFQRSNQILQKRQQLVPKEIRLQNELPIYQHLPEILQRLRSSQVVIVAGETGSGKTTQLPLALLQAGYGTRGMIAHTQPRRLAARSVSQRMADQLGVALGQQVGYAVRFDEKWGKNTLVKVMTDGLLLNEINRDRFLSRYEVVVLDEAHERSLNIDFLIGVLHRLVRHRPNLKIIITSATIDVEAFSSHFDNAPIVAVEGRSYPVQIHYRPTDDDVEQNVISCITEIQQQKQQKVRDILMFLATEREIFEWSALLKRQFREELEVLPLYARLPPKEQVRVFSESKKQRILLATNVAETSLTVPNIRYVIDLGTARISRYSTRLRVQRLPIEQISQASANQRSGRCGRLAPGVCYRIYDEREFEKSNEYTEPEIKRSNLSSVVLQALQYRLGNIREFPFLNPPQSGSINDAFRTLAELGALEDEGLSKVGKTMAQFNVDPRLSRMLIEAEKRQALHEVAIIVALIASQDPRLRPITQQDQADEAHREFKDPKSDFVSLLNLWKYLEEHQKKLSRRKFNQHLEQRFISHNRVREWQGLHRQLTDVITRLGMKVNAEPASYRNVHTSILAGSLNLIGMRDQDGAYKGLSNLNFLIIPGSPLQKSKPKWVLAGEIAETSRVFARMVAKVEPRWIEDVAKQLLSYSYFDPYWDEKKGEAMILCNGNLRGLTIINRRPVKLASQNPKQARRLLIEHCLVGEQKGFSFPFLSHNRELLEKTLEIQARERRTDLVASDRDLVAFYLERLPESVYSVSSFQNWYKSASERDISQLLMTEADLLLRSDSEIASTAFPSELVVGEMTLPLRYRFANGEIDDGVSLRVTADQILQLPDLFLDWHVPGFFARKCTALLQGLPKKKRKVLLPIAHRVEESLDFFFKPSVYRVGSLHESLRQYFNDNFRANIERGELEQVEVPPFLRINIQVVDHLDEILDQDRNVYALRERTEARLQKSISTDVKSPYEQPQLHDFPKEGLFAKHEVQTAAVSHTLYPTLVDRSSHVDLVMQSTTKNQLMQNERGICRLLLLRERQAVNFIRREFKKEADMVLQFAAVSNADQLLDNLLLAAARLAYLHHNTLPETKTEFDELLTENRGGLITAAFKLVDVAKIAIGLRMEVHRGIQRLDHPSYHDSRIDLEVQLGRLIPADFVYSTPFQHLSNLHRYLNAMLYRIDNISGRVSRDLELISQISRWENRLYAMFDNEQVDRKWIDLRFLVEEYRVGLFYQQMRARVKVSQKRLEREFTSLEATKLPIH